MSKTKVVVIGGGTGTSVVLSGLKQFNQELDLTAVVVVSDSGGSTGRLRDEFGFLPVGDIRQCLAALVEGKYQQQLRDLLLYRFARGNGLEGHNLGNLILTALEDQYASPGKAIEIASKIFRICGKVLPVSEDDVQLKITYQDGSELIGEHHLDNKQFGGKKIKQIELVPQSKIYSKASQAIIEADYIILGPGDLYASLLANALTTGFVKAISQSKAKFIFLLNLMTHYTQTHQMTALDHVVEVEKYFAKKPDLILVNNTPINQQVLEFYAKSQEFPVRDDLDSNLHQVLRTDLLAEQLVEQQTQDKAPRSLLRHDSHKVALALINLMRKGDFYAKH